MAESLSNVFDKNLFRHYFNFERGNLNPEYYRRLTACRQWKNAELFLFEGIIALRRLPFGAALRATARPVRACPRIRRA